MHGSMQQGGASATPLRYEALDCVRGVAALLVVVCHAIMLGLFRCEPQWSAVKWSPLRIVWSGHQAVILFFMLSGFSLFLMFKSLEASSSRTPVFIAARWLRLYPVYVFSLLFALGSYSLLVMAGFPWPDQAAYVPSPHLPADQFLLHLTLIGQFHTGLINPPMWSIVHEMRISLLFPLIYWLVERMRCSAAVVGLAVSLLIAIAYLATPQTYGQNSLALSLLGTLHYTTFFIVGALLARYRLMLITWTKQQRRTRTVPALVVALILYAYGFDDTWTTGEVMLGDLVIGIGSAVILVLALAFPVLPRSTVLLFLGRISYSLYLLHFTCFGVVAVMFYGIFPNPVLWAMVIALSLAVASASWLLIERPALKWSRAVRAVRRNTVIKSTAAVAAKEMRPQL